MSFTDKEISERIEFNTKLANKIQDKLNFIKNNETEQCNIHSVVFNEADYLYQTCELDKEIMCRCKNDRDCKNQSEVELCEHNGEEILHQGNGFVYKTCADCGGDI